MLEGKKKNMKRFLNTKYSMFVYSVLSSVLSPFQTLSCYRTLSQNNPMREILPLLNYK